MVPLRDPSFARRSAGPHVRFAESAVSAPRAGARSSKNVF